MEFLLLWLVGSVCLGLLIAGGVLIREGWMSARRRDRAPFRDRLAS